MILLNEEQRLGGKAFTLLLLRSLIPGAIILVISLVLFLARGGIQSIILFFMKLGGGAAGVSRATEAAVAHGVSYAITLALLFALVSIVMSIITARVEYKDYTFTFEEFGMRLKRGLFRSTVLTIPYRQMQDVKIERGFLHQMTGTSRVVINSAGREEPATRFRPAESTNIVLDPIDHMVAEEIRLMLQRKIGVQVVEGEREADREALEDSSF